jgi:hypothetical protein
LRAYEKKPPAAEGACRGGKGLEMRESDPSKGGGQPAAHGVLYLQPSCSTRQAHVSRHARSFLKTHDAVRIDTQTR